ncbi:hypothetical protein N7451_009133 [Penicillium sp. IBT 35674x]|nr:hypothetical protein N7451_009133 [Penicillium sp. IBT 35674x]
MEVVNKVINMASHSIRDDTDVQPQNAEQSQDERISGVQSQGAANDSYDPGKRDEQPDASTSNANTAPQEPKPDGQSLTSVPQQAASSTSDRPSATPTTDMGSTTATGSPNTAAAGLSNSTVDTNTGTKADDGKKQRDTDNTHVDENAQKQVHQGRRGTAAIMEDHGVSRETLKGPQGPAPHPAADFEKEGRKETKNEQPAGSKSEDSKNGGGFSGSNEKQGVMSKMKEGLTKVAHPHHGK